MAVHTPVDGSYNSALFKLSNHYEPATNTLPFASTDAVWMRRGPIPKFQNSRFSIFHGK